MTENNNIIVPIEDEMQKSYLDYAMSVIVSRAIPDVCDGLKPVHRRILYSMFESGSYHNRPYKKSARIVGEVMGKYHPHGDGAIYDALVRMAQDFSMRLPLVDGQGNFGSMDGDSPAAMRYTESRLEKVSHSLLDDIDKDTVNFHENYDGSEQEPDLLPAKFPNLLVNGAGGIAVGMATNIPPHNLGEVIEATIAYVKNEELSLEEIHQIIPGPDFPTGGIILGRSGPHSAAHTGRGSIIVRAKTDIETNAQGKQSIVITEVPYQVNKARLVEKIAELVRDKKVEGISDLRDESNKKGVRVVIELKKDTIAEVVLNQLYNYSQLQTSFGVNLLALHNGKPQLMNLLQVIQAFVTFRENVITRRTVYLLNKARDRAHILIGLALAVDSIDKAITIIRGSANTTEAKQKLLAEVWEASKAETLITLIGDNKNAITDGTCRLTEIQVQAILDMKLARLTGLERDKIADELAELKTEIEKYLAILGDRQLILNIMEEELAEIKEKFATPRRTIIEEGEYEHDIESLIAEEDMVITVTVGGYIKRVPLDTYRAQKRGGKGRAGLKTKNDDVLTEMFVTTTHNPVLFFSNRGQVYKLKAYRLPLASPQTQGRALVNIFPLAEGEKITTILPLPKDEDSWSNLNIAFATAKGNIRRSDMEDFRNVQSNGKIAIRLDEDDQLVGVRTCTDDDHILLASASGKSIRFPVDKLRVIKSRTSNGVKGISLAPGNKVISITVLREADITREQKDAFLSIPVALRKEIATCTDQSQIAELLKDVDINLSQENIISMAQNEEFILTITENGFGKRSSAYEYRITNRGGSGIINIITSERNGNVIASFPASDAEEIVIMTDKGKIIRCKVSDIRIAGRNTQGVTILKTDSAEKVVSVASVPDSGEGDSENIEDDENSNIQENDSVVH